MSLAEFLRAITAFTNRFAARLAARNIRLAAFGFGMLALGACSDLPTDPTSGSLTGAGAVIPAVVDARYRLANAIRDIPARQKLILGLSDLEIALRQGDANHARNYAATVTSVLEGYRVSGNASDADVAAINLALSAVSTVVGTASP